MTEMTPIQAVDHHLGQIREYAIANGLSGEHIALIFEAGIGATAFLRPELLQEKQGLRGGHEG